MRQTSLDHFLLEHEYLRRLSARLQIFTLLIAVKVLSLSVCMQGSLGISLKEVRPTHFLGVPRVWEKMQEAISAAGKQNGILKRRIASWAKDIGLESNLAVMNG